MYAVGYDRLNQHGRWLAAVLACGEGAALSHGSAAALWGLARDRGPIDVTCSPGRSRRPGIRPHEGMLHESERIERGSIPVTTVARTLFDYAEVTEFARLEHAWEEADKRRLLRLTAVERICERGHGRRALKPIRRLLAEARTPTEGRSPLEERFQRFLQAYRLPPGSTNVEVLGHEVDVLWPAARLIVELNSWEHHGHRAALRVTHRRLDREAGQLAKEIRQLLSASRGDPAGG